MKREIPQEIPPHLAADSALFLDFDGTLVEIAPTPEAVEVDPQLFPILVRLRGALGGALAVVSGRRIADIDGYLAPLVLPAAGLHGLERRRADGVRIEAPVPTEAMERLRPALCELEAALPGTMLEDKGLTLALHYRQAPHHMAQVIEAARRLHDSCAGAMRLIEGKMVVEFQPQQADKGAAILAFMEESPFRGRRPVFVGDDVTDEDGFAAVNRIEGVTVRVGGPVTAARWRLPGVPALRRWLADAADLLAPATEG